MLAMTDRAKESIRLSHRPVVRVECWLGGRQIGEVETFGGAVTEEARIGTRYSVTTAVSPDDAALVAPGVELRPYRGISFGNGQSEMWPLGRFVMTKQSVRLRKDLLQVNASDLGSWFSLPLVVPFAATPGVRMTEQIQRLISSVGQFGTVTITATSTAMAQPQVFTDRLGPIADLSESIGAEAFCDRLGVPTIRDRPALAASAVWTLATGDGGTILDIVEDIDTERAYNAVVVTGTNADPIQQFPPVIVRITDPTHPAYPRPGVPVRPFQMSGPQFTSAAQARPAGEKKLSRVSGPARQMRVSCFPPNPALEALDTISLPWNGTSELHQIDTITHPLSLDGIQDITAVTGREDDE